jgi:Fe-S-cluster-containing dehydrogenase component
MFAHEEIDNPIKCDMCGDVRSDQRDGQPQCVAHCPKQAIRLIPEQSLGESKRMSNVLSYAHMKEIEFMEKGEKKVIRYAEIGKEVLQEDGSGT